MSTSIPSSYSQDFALPEALPEVLKELTREILREQPEDFEQFALAYFRAKLDNGNNGRVSVTDQLEEEEQSKNMKLMTMSPQEIEDMIHALFKEQDANNNHTLDRNEFKQVFHKLGRSIGLRKNDVRRILAEADCDGNGEISYSEFIPVAVSIIETIVAKEQLKDKEEAKARHLQDAEQKIYHGMPASELNEILTSIFKEADKDNSGALDLEEFERCLGDIRVGITRKEVNLLMFETYSKDGMIDYEAFKPICMELLVELAAAEWIAPSQDEKDLADAILTLCEDADTENTGLLHMEQMQSLLHNADLGMTLVQICSILSEAKENDQDMVDYKEFVPRAAFMIHACQNYRARMASKQELMQNLHSSEGWGVVFGRDRDTLEAELETAFHTIDATSSGCLSRDQIKQVILQVLPDIDRKTLTSLVGLAKVNEAGSYAYQGVIDHTFRTLKSAAELSILFED